MRPKMNCLCAAAATQAHKQAGAVTHIPSLKRGEQLAVRRQAGVPVDVLTKIYLAVAHAAHRWAGVDCHHLPPLIQPGLTQASFQEGVRAPAEAQGAHHMRSTALHSTAQRGSGNNSDAQRTTTWLEEARNGQQQDCLEPAWCWALLWGE
jgi:hypothetical protein